MNKRASPAEGVLRGITDQARNHVYRADEVLQAIEGPIGAGQEMKVKADS